jgi:polar amino acid transport system substrate-binding protein
MVRKRTLTFITCLLTLPCWGGESMRVEICHTEPWGYYTTTDRADANRRAQPAGIVADIASAISRESGIPFDSNLTPVPRIGRDLKTGEADISFLIRSEEHDTDVIYLGYLFPLDGILLARPGTTLRSYDDIAPLRIGVIGDSRLNYHFDHDSTLRKIEFRDYEAMIDTLLAGRIDAVAGNSISIEFLLAKRGFGQTANWPRLLLQKNQVWAQMSKRSAFQQHTGKLRTAIERLRNQGFFDHLIARYTTAQSEEFSSSITKSGRLISAP